MQQKELIQTVSNITSVSRSIVAEMLKTTACVVAETLAEGQETEVKVPDSGSSARMSARPASCGSISRRAMRSARSAAASAPGSGPANRSECIDGRGEI